MEEALLVGCGSPNYIPLSPISFIERASIVHGDKVSIVYGTIKYSWRQTHQRCINLASALSQLHISPGNIVAALAPNIPALYELHFGVPMAGAVLCALNPKLDTSTLASILQELEAKIIFVDYQFIQLVLKAFDILSHLTEAKPNPLLVLIPELDQSTFPIDDLIEPPPDTMDYNSLLATGNTDFNIKGPSNECDPISINYTSGSTGSPKGVVYSHRAAYLNSMAKVFRCDDMRDISPVFLWTVDMFRCNGWCFTWAMAAIGGTNICLRNVSGKIILDAISLHNVTHLCGATIILNMIAAAAAAAAYSERKAPCREVEIMVAGALPPSQILTKIVNMGFNLTHAYGMTEALGPVITTRLLELNQNGYGFDTILMEGADVKDPGNMKSVPSDGKTVGEVMFKGNTLMMGYFKNPKATRAVFENGWFRTGDFGIKHHDGRIEMKDRLKDAIVVVSKGREIVTIISTLEVEAVLLTHPMVLEAAVVGKHDDDHYHHLGNMAPCFAFVKLKDRHTTSADEIIKFCEKRLPCLMVPQSVVFGDLPVNSTGKIQKFVLRERTKAVGNPNLNKINGAKDY